MRKNVPAWLVATFFGAGYLKPGPGTYGFETHAAYLDAFLQEVELDEPVVLVLHDWGSALGFDWARRHPDQVRGIAFFEALAGLVPEWLEREAPLRLPEGCARPRSKPSA